MSINNNNPVDKSTQRPIFLNLFVIRLPIGGIVSIVHRASGVLLVLLTPAAIYLLDRSLTDARFFLLLGAWYGQWWFKLTLILLLLTFIQHFYSGLRHLALDMDWGIGKRKARATAWLSFVATALTLLAIGVMLP